MAGIGAQLVALASEPDPATQVEVADVVEEVAAEVAADVAAAVATVVAEEVADDQGEESPDETADLIVTSELAHAAAQVEIIDAQAAADVAVIEAEAQAEVDVIDALGVGDQSGDDVSPDAGDDPSLGVVAPLVIDGDGGDQDSVPDSSPSPSHPWFRPLGSRR